jgi:hypothetical protein
MEMMRKFFIALLIGIILIPSVNAAWRRYRPTYSFQRAEKTKTQRYSRSRWRIVKSPYKYRFSQQYNRTDRLLWRTMEPRESTPEQIESPISTDFCNYHNSILGEYLPSEEVSNRCCVCLDGWKCEYSAIVRGSFQRICDPDWTPPNTTGE